jgi:tetratricopeptide (TPR) repeat protein
MKRICSYLLRLILCVSFLTVVLYPHAFAAERCEQWVAKVVSVQGNVEVRMKGETQWQPVTLYDTYCPGDQIRLQEQSRADIALVNQPVLRLDQNTTITLGGVKEERTSVINLVKGAAHFFSRVRRNLEVVTAFVNAGVEGTEFFVRVEKDQTFLSIFEGKVLASNKAGELALTSGQAAVAEKGKAPVLKTVVRPRDAVQWALYYPPVMYEKPPAEDTSDPHYLAYRASLLLSVGRVDDARADLEKSLRLKPAYSDALALQSIIAVVQNEKEKALDLARKAVEADATSATAQIAHSYAQQANFDLEGARASLQEAVNLEPENALAWARLAELWSSFGNLDKSLEAAQKAVDLSPNLSRTQTVLGFAYLTQVNTKEAKVAFEKAIEFDQADPLPRLGLGLTKIREGKLDEGGREIEIAASLNPNSSLIRSYLGKTYFEKKHPNLDGREYAIAKELDPNDPTPWFYDAIAKQTTNRPVEALHDMQKAVELNDNRAVYRSKLMLDSDLAARSASQARIYSDLGFQQRALVEGWNSVNTDPTNYSAHRFLADSYSVLPRHEIARVSELLQSQLLQPTNITPIQPQLAESNLYLISSGGAANTSFNEFNPLFNRNQTAFQASGIVGENKTWGGEGVVSGIYNKVSLSAGYNHFETDGWRKNAFQDDDIANVFVQYELSHKTSIQAEYRYRDTENGDLQLRFFQDDYNQSLTEKEETDSIRLGVRHTFSPSSVLLGNFAYQDTELNQEAELDPATSFDRELPEDASSGELQYLYRSKKFNIVSGAGYFNINAEDQVTVTISTGLPPPFPPTITQEATFDRDISHTNLYFYSYIDLLENVSFTIGASGDFFKSDAEDTSDEEQFNPKLGVIWSPAPSTTVRAAAFRVLKRTLITDQTLEPTQVAGFNQFFDDINATDAWSYGAAVDQKFSKSLYGGMEYSVRDMEVPFNPAPGQVEKADWDENMFRAYLCWAPYKMLALRADYLWEKFDRADELASGAKDVETHSFPLGISFFHQSGLNATFTGTYIDQQGSFERSTQIGIFEDGEDNFWLFDLALNYRLPKRKGFISVGVKNLFDEEFQFFDTDPDNPRIQPERSLFAKVTFALR